MSDRVCVCVCVCVCVERKRISETSDFTGLSTGMPTAPSDGHWSTIGGVCACFCSCKCVPQDSNQDVLQVSVSLSPPYQHLW